MRQMRRGWHRPVAHCRLSCAAEAVEVAPSPPPLPAKQTVRRLQKRTQTQSALAATRSLATQGQLPEGGSRDATLSRRAGVPLFRKGHVREEQTSRALVSKTETDLFSL